MVNVVATNYIARASAANVDRVSVAKLFHGVRNFVQLNDVVVRVKKRSHVFCVGSVRQSTDLVASDCSTKLPALLFKKVRHATRKDYSGVGSVVYEVVGDPIFAALPNQDARRMPIDLTDMVNVVVIHEVLAIHVLGSGAVTAQENAGTAHLLDMVARDVVLLTVQINADRAAATMCEVTVFDRAILCAAKTHQ